MSRKRSAWGSVRQLASGRWQASYRGADLKRHNAPHTFATRREADRWLAETRAAIAAGAWTSPREGLVTLADYAARWIEQRPELRPRTRDLYDGYLRLHIMPTLGTAPMARITTPLVRTWRADLIKKGHPGESTIAKCYRLLHAICASAVVDGIIPRNPCALAGAAVERPAERPVATVEQVFALADAIDRRYRALVLLATFCGLRVGELRALRQKNLDLLHGEVRVVEQVQQLADGTQDFGPPKTAAGVRSVTIPATIVCDLESHLAEFTTPGPDELVFTGERGQLVRLASLQTAWRRAVAATGVDARLRVHDLRHTGATLAAATGASTKELMSRMGHASPRAALIYQHATADRDRLIADKLSAMIDAQARSS